MRIAVSDYDGTINIRGRLVGEVIQAVREWREAGNLFGIATGRDLFMTKRETDRWEIPFDFLVVMNGGAIYDGDGSLLVHTLLPDDLIPAILRHPAALASMHYQLSGLEPLRLLLRDGSWFPLIGVDYEEVDFDTALEMKNLGQISLAYTTEEECKEWLAQLERDFGDHIDPHPNVTTIDLNARNVNKALGIQKLLEHKGWQDHTVHVIGDGGNDVEMIRHFGGYAVEAAPPAIKSLASQVYPDVAEMLRRV